MVMSADESRFWNRLRFGWPDECWPFVGSGTKNGYGQLMFGGRVSLAHRVSWQVVNGEIPADLLVLHRCDNRRCCNPRHLFLGTARDNTADMRAKGRQRDTSSRGTRNGSAKLNETSVATIRQFVADGAVIKHVAEQFGVSSYAVRSIRDGRTWKWL